MKLIRRFDRYYREHPNIAFAVMLVICAVVLYIAHDFDSNNDTALRMQMLVTNQRSMT
ncbi:hypothetical protein [Trinickia sp.]|uniref:hypothetical protein n=1 Tax=Trinickia sp. TaxID=2571163 RepID=UPI003F80A7CA